MTTDEMVRWFPGGRNRSMGLSLIVDDDEIIENIQITFIFRLDRRPVQLVMSIPLGLLLKF